MNSEYSLEEVMMTEDFSRVIYDWYNANYIINHPISRADVVRAKNQRTLSIFRDLNELNYLIEERKHTEAICHYGWMDDETKEVVPKFITDYLEKIKTSIDVTEDNNI